MDETFSTDLFDKDGKLIGRLGVEDLLHNNAEEIQKIYSRQVHGSSALAEVFRVMKQSDGEVIESIPQLLSRLERDARDLGHATPDGKLTGRAASDLAKVEVMAKITAGIPLTDSTATVRAFRTVRNLNFFKAMSGVGSGLQNAGEIVHAMSDQGLRAVVRQVPALGTIFKRAADGQLSHSLGREIEVLTGMGVERIVRRVTPRVGSDEGVQLALSKAETLSARAARLAADASLVAPGQTFIQRWVSRIIAQRWFDIANSGKLPKAQRLAGMGLTPDMARRVTEQLKAHAIAERGFTGSRVARLNVEQWTDMEAASFFRAALSKTARRLVLVNNQAAYAKWMTTETGKVISQLRTFAFGAWTNKLLYEVKMRDARAFANIAVTTVAAGLVYTARTYMDSIGRHDRKEFLRDRLATDKIALAAFSRAAWSSLIPVGVDTIVADIGQRKPVFSYARTTGLEGGALFGNPTVDWINAARRSLGAIQAPFAEDYDFSRQDVRSLRDAAWVPNLIGLRNLIDQLARRLPERSLD